MAKIAVSSNQGGLEDQVSSVFGRCQTFTLVEAEGNQIKDSEIVQNQYANERSGAGIQAAGFIANQGVEAIIASNFGPNVTSVFNEADIKMAPASGMSVRDAVQKYLKGDIKIVTQATASAKAGGGGMGRGMGRRMTSQTKENSERAKRDLEGRLDDIEDQIEKIKKSLDEL